MNSQVKVLSLLCFFTILALGCSSASKTPATTGTSDAAALDAQSQDVGGTKDASDVAADSIGGGSDQTVADVPAAADATATLDAQPADTADLLDTATATDTTDAGSDSAADTGSVADSVPFDVSIDGPKQCQAFCDNLATAKCPNEDPIAQCLSDCNVMVALSAGCTAEYAAVLECGATASISCGSDGKTKPSACQDVVNAAKSCTAVVSASGSCNVPTCSGSASSGGPTTCGCEAVCSGSTYKLTCDGTTCNCSMDGLKITSFAQGQSCGTDPSGTFKASCGLP